MDSSKKIKSASINVMWCDVCTSCVFVHLGAADVYDDYVPARGPICEIRAPIVQIRAAQKGALFCPDMLRGVADSYNDSFGHTINTSHYKYKP